MAEENSGSKPYRVVQNEGKISWRIEELWEGGAVREPFGSKDSAINAEKEIARNNGFIDALVLQEAGEEKTLPTEAFEKDDVGTWRCLKGCSVSIDKTEMVFTEGSEFVKGNLYMGIDVAKWLDENAKE